ncbi:MAG: putative LPS assembly protein LptD [Imperialibacter sp.]|uniref:putative LPS assembly protein LptD n=1 Tax=Imperialibacter sp. TaxID=2038411 RepID=UPI0032EC5904
MLSIKNALLLAIGIIISTWGHGQNLGQKSGQDSIAIEEQLPILKGDTLVPKPEQRFLGSDTLSLPGSDFFQNLDIDSLVNKQLGADTLRTDSAEVAKEIPKSDIETAIKYEAADSIFLDVNTQRVMLYGEGKINYGKIELQGNRIDIDWPTNTIKANYTTDSLGKKVGVPVFTEGDESYNAQDMTYNFKTRKALVNGIVTQQGDAYMHGEKVKMNASSELFIRNAKYTTCNLEDPHFHIASSKLKVIPGNKVVSGPFNLHFRSIPTPLGFAFGMFPQPKKKVSGVLVPKYGEERRRGFFLKDGGYYFAINDYMDLALTAQVFSKGSYGATSDFRYKKRYAFNGNMNLSFNRNKGEKEEDSLSTKDYWIRWSHTPETKGTFRISSSVNAGSSTYSQNNYQSVQFNTNAQFNSSVSMSKTFTGTPFNASLNFRQSQNVQTKSMTISAPEFTLNTNRFFPLAWITSGNASVLDKLSVSHNFSLKNEFNNTNPNYSPTVEGSEQYLPVNSDNLPSMLRNSKNGGRHSVPISTTFNVFKFISVSPSFNYTEWWYLKELNRRWDDEQKEVVADTIRGFSRAGSYSFGTGFSTRLYGMVFVKGEKVEAIRHVITPTISLSYSPDFSEEKYGIYQNVQNDSLGRTKLYSKYDGFVFGGPGLGKSGSIGFSLNNNFEMKVRDRKDSTQEFKKVKLLDNLSISSGYNLLADSFNLSTIGFTTRTLLFNKLDINYRMTLDPYLYVLDSSTTSSTGARTVYQTKVDEFTWNHGQGLGNLSNASIALSTSLNPKAQKEQNKDKESEFGTEEEKDYIRTHPDQYVDFNIPWDLRLSYNVDFRKTGFADPVVTQSFTMNGNTSITENTKITFSSGYDFKNKEITQTRLGIIRDIHCWELSVDWTPFGRFTSYSVTLRAKSSLLQDLKLSKQRSFFDSF